MRHGVDKNYIRVRLPARRGSLEWRTLALIVGCYAVWFAAGMLYAVAAPVSVGLLALAIALHSSLQHEAVHRHPTSHAGWNEALVFLPLGLLVPFRRYCDLHLRHHADDRLTDPYDDPESYYLSRRDYQSLPSALRVVLGWNNRLLARVAIGPAIGAIRFLRGEIRAMFTAGDRDARANRLAWGLHAIGLLAVMTIVRLVFAMPVWAYLVAAYLGLSLLAIRSFCEHRWAAHPDHRTVIVERSWLSLLFLNNNLHLVHHKLPGLPWYALPTAYRSQRADWRAINDGYVFASYRAVMRDYGLRAKEPVAHPHVRER